MPLTGLLRANYLCQNHPMPVVDVDDGKLEKLVFDGIRETPQFTCKNSALTRW
jgi:hypothetical protein